MNKWVNTVFFGSCFMIAILLEAYGMIIWEGQIFSTVALGIVVLITGFLFMDSVRSRLLQSGESMKGHMEFYFDQLGREVSEKWTEKHTEIVNLQKASYTATKKNTILLNEQFEGVLLRLETLERTNAEALQSMIELQKKALEGQKNALNFELNYNKENTKKIIEAFKEDSGDKHSEQLARILDMLEKNNTLLKEQIELQKNASESSSSIPEEMIPKANESKIEETTINREITPLYEDPNKNLTADEIAKLFASFGQ